MRERHEAANRLLKTMMVASVAIPLAIFSYASWAAYHNAFEHADEQLSAALDVISEHANKIFQSVDLTFTSVDAIIGDLSDQEIKASEQALHLQLSKLEKAVNAIDGILVVDKSRAYARLVGTVPDSRHRRRGRPRLFPGAGQTRRRHLYRHGLAAAGATGTVLRRQPPPRAAERRILRDHHGLRDTEGLHRVLQPTGRPDRRRRLLARAARRRHSRPLPDAAWKRRSVRARQRLLAERRAGVPPAASSPATIRSKVRSGGSVIGRSVMPTSMCPTACRPAESCATWLQTMSAHLYFGLPATIFLFMLVLLTMRRTREFYAEAERRELRRGRAAAGAEDGSGRPVDRRRGARLQQSPDHHHRQSRHRPARCGRGARRTRARSTRWSARSAPRN